MEFFYIEHVLRSRKFTATSVVDVIALRCHWRNAIEVHEAWRQVDRTLFCLRYVLTNTHDVDTGTSVDVVMTTVTDKLHGDESSHHAVTTEIRVEVIAQLGLHVTQEILGVCE